MRHFLMGNERLKYVYRSYTFNANEPVMCSKAFQLTVADLTRGFIDFICKHGKYRPTPSNPHVPILHTNNLSEDSSIHWFSISSIFNSTQNYSSNFSTKKRRMDNSSLFVTLFRMLSFLAHLCTLSDFDIMQWTFLNEIYFGKITQTTKRKAYLSDQIRI